MHAAASPRTFLCSGLAERDDAPRHARSPPGSPSASTRCCCCSPTGSGSGAIGSELYMSESTVKSHIGRIYQKLGATNRAQALVTAMRVGLLSNLRQQA